MNEEKLIEHNWVRLQNDYLASMGLIYEFFECRWCLRRKTGDQIPYGQQQNPVAGFYHCPDPAGCLGREGYTLAEQRRSKETDEFIADLQRKREAEEVRLRTTPHYRANRDVIEIAKRAYEHAKVAGDDPEAVYNLALSDAERESQETKTTEHENAGNQNNRTRKRRKPKQPNTKTQETKTTEHENAGAKKS